MIDIITLLLFTPVLRDYVKSVRACVVFLQSQPSFFYVIGIIITFAICGR